MSDPVTRLNAALRGRYRIERQLGEGGMATVYLADDLRHERKVALKVLKPELAAVVGAERFLAEIKTTANLQHPHILPLFDSGEADGFLFYVMPYVEGESLRERLDRQHQLPVEEAVRIASDVAEALDYAHSHGVIHRDIKPANILLHAGRPLIADFGIALAISAGGAGRLTETGLSLGTPHYMSPEQATGDVSVGPATDIYALGCVLYEMLVGEPPYTGSTPQAVLGKIIQAEPMSATKTRHAAPANADAAIRKALEKIPADRFTAARQFATALGDPAFRYREVATVGGVTEGRGQWTPAAIGAAAVALASTLALAWALLRPSAPAPVGLVSRQVISVPPSAPVTPTGDRPDVAISSDGSRIVYQSAVGASPQLSVRALDDLRSVTVRDESGAMAPFLSPDGQSIGFQASNGALQRVSVQGGTPASITQLDKTLWGASWGPGDMIVFGVQGAEGLYEVPAAGGEPKALTTPVGVVTHAFPDVLPDGQAVLFVISTNGFTTSDDQIALLDLRTGAQQVIIARGTSPRYASSGHILYAVGNTLMAVAFDAKRRKVMSEPVPVVEGVAVKGDGAASFSVSEAGSLVYVSSRSGPGSLVPVWVDRSGKEELLPLPPRGYQDPRVSPDGRSLSTVVAEQDGSVALWVYDVVSAAGTRLTHEGQVASPFWLPDGRIGFSVAAAGEPFAIDAISADGRGDPEGLVGLAGIFGDFASSVTRDGRYLIFTRLLTTEHREIFRLPLTGGSNPEPLLQGDFARGNGQVSPDGQWLLYRSNQTGQLEVYVQPYPGPGPASPVSVGGGTNAVWSRDGTEVFYRHDDKMMAVSFDAEGDQVRIGQPEELFRGDFFTADAREYDVAPDGRFLMLRAATGGGGNDEPLPQVILVQNFFEELKRLVPPS